MKTRKIGFWGLLIAVFMVIALMATPTTNVSLNKAEKAFATVTVIADQPGFVPCSTLVSSSDNAIITMAVKEEITATMQTSTISTLSAEVTLVKKGIDNTANMTSAEATLVGQTAKGKEVSEKSDLVYGLAKKSNNEVTANTNLSSGTNDARDFDAKNLANAMWVSDLNMMNVSFYVVSTTAIHASIGVNEAAITENYTTTAIFPYAG